MLFTARSLCSKACITNGFFSSLIKCVHGEVAAFGHAAHELGDLGEFSQINIAEHTTDCLFCDLSK